MTKTTTYIVKYTESERGWGGEIWYRRFIDKEAALEAVYDCNKDLPSTHTPDYYIQAEYIGIDEDNNPKYDSTYKY